MTFAPPLPRALALVGAEVDGVAGCTVRVVDEVVAAVGPEVVPAAGDELVDAGGGAVLPGLHDHHLHLRAMAAALESVDCGPPAVRDRGGLLRVLERAEPRRGWVRGVGYHESVAGLLDRDLLDSVRADVPVRVQHRSGLHWYLNTRAVLATGAETSDHPGIARDGSGRATGCLRRMDDWLAGRIGPATLPLDVVTEQLARRGVTGVTDATVTNDDYAARVFAELTTTGRIVQRVYMMGRPDGDRPRRRRFAVGPLKVVLDEDDLPDFAEVVQLIADTHATARAVAVHASTRATLAYAIAAFRAARTRPGDRVEHASVCPPELAGAIRELGITVVTQPNFVRERGSQYRAAVDPSDRPWLYPVGLLDRVGVRTAGGTDAPFGIADPWAAVAAAVERRAEGGVLGPGNAVTAARALELFLGPLDDPGGPARRVEPGAPADLCVLAAPLATVLRRPGAGHVRATIAGGRWVRGPAD